MTTSLRQRAYIRDLATQVSEIAASDQNARIKQRWRDVNALRKPDRAPVWCKPVGAWAELLPPDSLRCTDPRLASIERQFRQVLIKKSIDDDSPVESWFGVPARFRIEPDSLWGLEVRHESPHVEGGAWAYDPPLKRLEDFERLTFPTYSYQQAETESALSRTHDLLGDILPVKLVCGPPLSATLGTAAADLRGLNEMMVDMAANPALMHRLMAHLRDGVLRAMNQVAAAGLLTPNNTGAMTCSDPIGETAEDGSATYRNLWGSANSQEFDAVSPEMWEEFCLNYQRPILERFGLACYGCCENLTHKIGGVLSIPNLRIFVSSAWTDLDRLLEQIGPDYVIMWRQKASSVVFPDDLASIERHLDKGMKKLHGRPVQIVLRELQTLAGHPDRLRQWTRLAKEAAARYA